jgi:serine protease Do
MMTPRTRRRTSLFAAGLMAATALTSLALWRATPAEAQIQPPAITAPATPVPLPGFADLVARVRPAVVTITATEGPAVNASARGGDREEMMRRFFGGEAPRRGPGQAMGSGFLVDAEGRIVTNNHVIRDASQVRVTLEDGREFPARVIGRDARTDLALLKVDAPAPLPFLALGDSDRARPGDWVVALGNPFGLGGTVTAGVVSARGRNIGQGPYDDFLQIDAPINQGNSGGPLFGLDGSVIGVNTAIYSPTGGSVGIGFAIPSNLVRQVVQQLEANGRVERGFLGAATQPLTPQLAEALRLPAANGALVAELVPDSPAARAGLKPGDVVTSLDGRAVRDPRELARAVAEQRPGAAVTLGLLRDGAAQELRVTLASLPGEKPEGAERGAARAPRGGALGLALAPLDEQARAELGLPRNARGAVVAEVRPDSPAAAAGLRAGDVLTGIAGRPVANAEQAARALREGANRAQAVQVQREGRSLFLALPAAQG